ncbi:helix-turn-helix domain-containing protein [Runella sp.]|uniref:helix-turn-helix domain-containing protein n=1 Tax=Runella sp. TaxID=1960881 RepID=UPI003D10890F
MNSELSERLAAARRMSGLSLQELSDRMGNAVSRQAIHQFEQGKAKPESDTLLLLAKALGVRLDYFYRDIAATVTLEKIEYRKKQKLTKAEETAIHEKAKDVLERYFELENLVDAQLIFESPLENVIIHTQNDIEDMAELIRQKWQLGMKPIPSVIEMLEEKGIKVLEIDASESFQGLCANANGSLVVVINQNDDDVRKRFTAIHELAHILLTFAENVDTERFCHRFAAALLFPRQSVIEVFSNKRKKIALAELLQVKAYYGISIQATLIRLRDLDIITDATYKGFMIWMTKVGYRKKEPGIYKGVEKAMRFSQLLYRAAIEEVISLSKAASLGNQTLTEFRRTLAGTNNIKA